MSADSEPQFEPVSLETWRARVEQELGAADFERTLVTRTLEGIDVAPLYAGDPVADAGAPGERPFVRGGAATTISCPLHRHADLRTAREALRDDLEGGAGGAWLDLERTPLHTASELEALLDALSPTLVVVEAGQDALPAAASAGATALFARTTLWLGADPLGGLARSGLIPGDLEAVEGEMVELAAALEEMGGAHRAVLVSTTPHHAGGAHAVQELGYAMATLAHYLRVAERHGVDLAAFARRTTLRFSLGRDPFTEIAKLRAARGLAAHLLRACGVDDVVPAIHAVSSERTATRRDPWVNMLRVTTGAFAGLVGGAEAFTALPFDLPLGVPSDLGRRLARNTITIMREESHLERVRDPLGGSWYVEALTDELATRAWAELGRIEAAGGMARHVTSGALAAELSQSWSERRRAVARRAMSIVGVTDFANLDEQRPERPDWPTATLDDSPVGDTPSGFSSLVTHARAGASISAMGRALERGAPTKADRVAVHRDDEELETLRAAAEQLSPPPRVFLAAIGPEREHKPRSAFARDFFAAGGIASVAHPGTDDAAPEEAAEALERALGQSGARLACICGADARYETHAGAAAGALKAAGAETVLFAGRPGEAEEALRAAGVDGFIHRGSSLPKVLAPLLRGLGARLLELDSEEDG